MKRARLSRVLYLPLVAAAFVVIIARPEAAAQKFYPDDPRHAETDDQDASRVRRSEITHALDLWQAIRGAGDRSSRLAMNVNSTGEVPDSSWFTNRITHRPLSVADIARGPDTLPAPPSGPWTIVAGKTDGITPGLRMKDGAGRLFFVKFDPRTNPEMASGAEVIATKLLFAAGYRVPENYIATVGRDDFIIGAEATFTGPDRKKRAMTTADVDQVLRQAARNANGSYRVVASLSVEGRPVGPFQYFGTRPDDPNDVVPHEHRRELRALRVFAAWLNHVDTKGQNSLDTLVQADGRTVVRHYLLDFGSALGSAGTEPKDWRDGYEYGFDGRTALVALLTLGTSPPPWRRIHYPNLPAVGRIESEHFEPERWKPTVPNPAFDNARADDTFWAAQRVMAFSNDAIRAAVRTARFSDPASSRYLSEVLINRRDRVGRAWLTAVNPVTDPSIDRQGRLTFRNAASDSGVATEPVEYRVRWSLFDNTTQVATALGPWTSIAGRASSFPTGVPATVDFVMAEIAAIHPRYPAWKNPVRAYFRRHDARSWALAGFERPDGAN